MERNVWLVIGISGVTCSGKTTLTSSLYEQLSDPANVSCLSEQVRIGQVKVMCQDDYFHAEDHPNHEWIEYINHVNYDTIGALNMTQMCSDMHETLGRNFHLYSKAKPTQVVNILIVEGFMIFNNSLVNRICQLKFHIHLPYEKCYERRTQRTYDPPDCLGYFELCVWPMYEQNFDEIKDKEGIVVLNGTVTREKLYAYVFNAVKEFL